MKLVVDVLSIIACILFIIDYIQARISLWVLFELKTGTWTRDGYFNGRVNYYIYQHRHTKMLKLKKMDGNNPKQHSVYLDTMNKITSNNLKIIDEEMN